MRFCSSAIFASLTSSGAATAGVGARFVRRGGLLSAGQPHDEHHQNGEANEQPGLHVFREQSGGLRAFVLWVRSWRLAHFAESGRENAELFLADLEITAVEDFRNDVHAFSTWKWMRFGLPSFSS